LIGQRVGAIYWGQGLSSLLIGDELGIRPFTFFEKGVVGHVGFADPFDGKIGKVYFSPW
jgi:hypothetical protein